MGQKVTFHPLTKIIQVDVAPVDGVVDLDVKIDLYSDGKEDWITTPSLMVLPFPIRSVGGDPLPGSKALGATFFLDNAWKIRPYEGNHTFAVNGNLYSEDGSTPFTQTVGTYNVMVMNTVSSLVDSTTQQLSELEFMAFGGLVTVDPIEGEPGIIYPLGTKEFPSNNISDSIIIDGGRFKWLRILSSMALNNGNIFTNFTIEGASHVNTALVIHDSAICDGITILNCNISGTLDGGTHISRCSVGSLNYVNGHIHNSGLYGTIILGGNKKCVIADCSTVDQDYPPIIDMGGVGQSLAMPNYSGMATIINLSDADQEIGIGLNAGHIIISNTVTAGTIVVAGIGTCSHTQTGTEIVDMSGLINIPSISDGVWDDTHDHNITDSAGAILRDIHAQTRQGNVSYEFVVAEVQNTIRKVDIGILDHTIIRIKSDDDSDWSSPISTKTQYYWYETIGDYNPIEVRESD